MFDLYHFYQSSRDKKFITAFVIDASLLLSMLGKFPVPGRPTNLDYSRARVYCACNRCGLGWSGHFFSRLSFHCSFSLSMGDGPI